VLYPYLSFFENLAFGLRARRVTRAEIDRRVAEVAAGLGLAALLDRRPATLSGGQRQRAALGRALVRRPRLLLLDEPFSSLDTPLRASIRAELIDLHRRLGTTMIHVTHDQAEALALGTRIAVLNAGKIVQTGAPVEVYEQPASRFVGEFVGSPPMNLLPCQVEDSGTALRLRIIGAPADPAWTIPADAPWGAIPRQRSGGRIDLGLRPEHVGLAPSPLPVKGVVRRLEPLGHETVATLAVGPHALTLRLPSRTSFAPGDTVDVGLDPAPIVWFDPETGRALH
jgi:multiple sugar transport system ATP-binding protein